MRMWALDQYYLWRIISVIIAIGLMQLPLPAGWSALQPMGIDYLLILVVESSIALCFTLGCCSGSFN